MNLSFEKFSKYFFWVAGLVATVGALPTVPDKLRFQYFRLYAPTEACFDKSWALPDIEKVK